MFLQRKIEGEDQMSDILNDPIIRSAVNFEKNKDALREQLSSLLTSTETWKTMNASQREVCVHNAVNQSESELELSRRLNDLGCTDHTINWCDVDPNDQTALEAQAMVKALGGLVSKSGSLVMIMTHEDMF